MSDEKSPPPLGATTAEAWADTELDGSELSDDDLEHVVGGLERAWQAPVERLPSEIDGADAHTEMGV